jgi:hypothetical protein
MNTLRGVSGPFSPTLPKGPFSRRGGTKLAYKNGIGPIIKTVWVLKIGS